MQVSIAEAVKQLANWKTEAAYKRREIEKAIETLGNPGLLISRLDELESKRLSFRRDTESKAATVQPFGYRVDVTIVAGSTARVPGN